MVIKGTRLVVVLLGVLIPIYIFIIFFFYHFDIAWFPWQDVSHILVQYIAPVLFTISFAYIFIILGTRIAGTLEILHGTSGIIPPHYFLFYGFNFIIAFFIFIVPVLIPFISFFAFTSMFYRLLTIKHDFEAEPKVGIGIKILCIIGALPALFAFILMVPELIRLAIFQFNFIWARYIDYIFQFTLALGSAAAIGEFILLFRLGSGEYQGYEASDSSREVRIFVFIFEAGYTALYYYFVANGITIWNYMLITGTIFTGLTFIINLIKGRGASGEGMKRNLGGYLIYGALLFCNYFFRLTNNSTWQWVIVVITVVIFGGSFLLIFFFHEDLEVEEE